MTCSSLFEILKRLSERLRRSFFSLNIFESGSTDEIVIESERLATRIYCIVIIIFLSLISGIGLIIERSINGYVSSPSSITFKALSSSYASTLTCPCTQISIPYGSFAKVKVELHQVCSSIFTTDQWIRSISVDEDSLKLSFFWQTINGLCQLNRKSIEIALERFQFGALISESTMTEDFLHLQAETAFGAILTETRSKLSQTLLSLQRIISGNLFVSGLGTNFFAQWSLIRSTWRPTLFLSTFEKCSCLNINGCPQRMPSELVSDCLTLNGVLQSSLKCYYNASCVLQLHPSINKFELLKQESNHRVMINATIQDIFFTSMIDQRSVSVDFIQYYQQCQPRSCSYTYSRRFDLLYVFTIIVGVYGGLNLVLTNLSPWIAKKISQKRRRRMRIHNINVDIKMIEDRSFHDRAKQLLSTLRQFIITLNLFQSCSLNSKILHRQRIMTRAFILLMIGAVIGCGSYAFFSIQTRLITISHPSLQIYERLYQAHSATLSCPCSRISIPYEKFLSIDYSLHQICSSTLVSLSWLQWTLDFNQSQFDLGEIQNYIVDFRRIGPSYFQLLATVCSIVRDTINNSLGNLGKARFVNKYLPSRNAFLQQMFLLNHSVTTSIKQEFVTTQNWLSMTAIRSQFLMGVSLNGRLEVDTNTNLVRINDLHMGYVSQVTETTISIQRPCSCRRFPMSCLAVSTLEAVDEGQLYPARYFVGMNPGCVPWVGLLNANTTWWYRADIIEQIRLLFGDHLRNASRPIIVPLDTQQQTRFRLPNGTYPLYSYILEEMLLEGWSGNLTRFNLFYHECAPSECTYTIQSQRDFLPAFLLLISICGGLNRILRWLTSSFILVYFYIDDRYRHRCEQGHWHIFRNIRDSLIQLNLFQSNSTEPHQLRTQRHHTRIYLCLLFFSTVAVVLYTGLEERAIVEIISPPTNATEYQRLQRVYSNTLQCPCSRTSLDYSVLIPVLQVQSFHPVCNSTFVSTTWTNYLGARSHFPSYVLEQDFRRWSSAFFDLVITLCSLARNQLDQSLSTFFSSSLITSQMLTQNEFEQQMNNTLNHLQQQIPAEFAQMVEQIRLVSQSNALVSIFSSNWEYLVRNNNRTGQALLKTRPISYNNGTCSCALSSQCSMPATIFDQQGLVFHTVEGLQFACTMLESVIQSSLTCFYSLDCINNLTVGMVANEAWLEVAYGHAQNSFPPISDIGSTFAVNDSFQTIINRMFINGWHRQVSYQAFFDSCAPRQCSYTRHYRFDPILVFTTFLSFFDGLSVGLRVIVLCLMAISVKLRLRNRAHPVRAT